VSVPLVTSGLCRSYGPLVALQPFDLEVGGGECVALVGANGSGKSTAVRAISGLLEPSAGTVRVCGHDPHREPDGERARAALALVPDAPVLYDDLTVRQHLELVALAHHVADPPVDAWLDRLGLAARAEFLPRELSRGMRQKTMLACALVRPAALLVLDEPVVGLDPPSQDLLRTVLAERKRAGAGVLLTTHQLAWADGLADRYLRLDEGAVVEAGPWPR
jgi:ABC-2 type transport system ATP-binding protein